MYKNNGEKMNTKTFRVKEYSMWQEKKLADYIKGIVL